MQALLYQKGINGLPTTQLLIDLTPVISSISYTNSAKWGCYEASVSFALKDNLAYALAEGVLGCTLNIYNEHGIRVWGGYVDEIKISGHQSKTKSLKDYANRVRIHYHKIDTSTSPPTDLGQATPIVANDTNGQYFYGIKEYNMNEGGLAAATATSMANAELAKRKQLFYTPSKGTSTMECTISATGWYGSLYNQSYTSTNNGTVETATLISSILSASCPFIRVATLATTGVSQKKFFDKYEFAGDIISMLMEKCQGYLFRIDADRNPEIVADNRAQLTTTYYESNDGIIRNIANGIVPPSAIIPNTIITHTGFDDPRGYITASVEKSSSLWISDVTYTDGKVSYKSSRWGQYGEATS